MEKKNLPVAPGNEAWVKTYKGPDKLVEVHVLGSCNLGTGNLPKDHKAAVPNLLAKKYPGMFTIIGAVKVEYKVDEAAARKVEADKLAAEKKDQDEKAELRRKRLASKFGLSLDPAPSQAPVTETPAAKKARLAEEKRLADEKAAADAAK